MITPQSIKVLPLMIVVAMLAFSVRFAEVVTGVSTLGATAMAQETEMPDADVLEEPMQEEAEASATEEDTAPIQISDEETPESQWRDASDEELEFSSVRNDIFEDLRARRERLDQKERDLVTREALLRAAEQELDRKYQELSVLRGDIENLLEQQSDAEQERLSSLVKIYEGMKPKDAARIFDTLDLDVLVSVMGKMSERRLSPILASMNPERARTITIMLAEQKQLPTLPQ